MIFLDIVMAFILVVSFAGISFFFLKNINIRNTPSIPSDFEFEEPANPMKEKTEALGKDPGVPPAADRIEDS